MIETTDRSSTPDAVALDFELPPALEAHEPPEARGIARDEVRLLVSSRDADRTVHANFRDLPWFLDAGNLVVVNDSATLPAALTAHTDDGDEIALHLSTQLGPTRWSVEPRGAAVRVGSLLRLPDGASLLLVAPHRGSRRLWSAELRLPEPVYAYLRKWGKPIAYRYVEHEWPLEAYQTVYARYPGSAEMPSAGRPFSGRVLDALAARGVGVRPSRCTLASRASRPTSHPTKSGSLCPGGPRTRSEPCAREAHE